MKHPEQSPRKAETDIEEIRWVTDALLDKTDSVNQAAIRALHHRHWNIISTAPGSSHNHQFWRGGYLEHIRQVNQYVAQLYGNWMEAGVFASLAAEEKFTFEEALTVSTLHDIEKPFRAQFGDDGRLRIDGRLHTKQQRYDFKRQLLDGYGIELNFNQQNAMCFAEGMRDADYDPTRRIMSPMAVLVHVADLMSARASFNVGNPGSGYPVL